MRLIDADKLREKAHNMTYYDDSWGGYTVLKVVDLYEIENAETVEPVKHGKWLKEDLDFPVWYICSLCGAAYPASDDNHYCMNCGAKNDDICS